MELNHNSITVQADGRDFSMQLFHDIFYKQIIWIFQVSFVVLQTLPDNEELTVELPCYFSPPRDHLMWKYKCWLLLLS